MLAFEAEMTAAEAAIGLPYVSHDIGSFHGNHLAPEELYARWVQLGAFQPMLRLHSDHGDRLPWEYAAAVEASAETFLRLREAMLPYNYTLGSLAHSTGAPLARPLWYAFPAEADAYANPTEFMWGDALLVAPVTVAGMSATTTVWLPPGQWIAFTDAGLPAQTLSGPGTYSIATTVASMPVFARAGAIVPLQSYTDSAAIAPATLEPRVFGGADGAFTLYEDAGEGLAYASGESATTRMTLSGSVFTIGATTGTYAGAPTERAYRIVWANVAKPAGVSVNGAAVPAAGVGGGDGWAYDGTAKAVTIQVAARPVSGAVAVQLM
jgi:alpha-glucosidase (family GH31 glycosyl hydrolase)